MAAAAIRPRDAAARRRCAARRLCGGRRRLGARWRCGIRRSWFREEQGFADSSRFCFGTQLVGGRESGASFRRGGAAMAAADKDEEEMQLSESTDFCEEQSDGSSIKARPL